MKPFLYICSQKETTMSQMVLVHDITLESNRMLRPSCEIEGILL